MLLLFYSHPFYFSFPFARAETVNVTIDDEHGDTSGGGGTVQYSPQDPGEWDAVSSDCDGCSVNPDPSLAFDGTWHDATYDSARPIDKQINISFHGECFQLPISLNFSYI